MSKKLFVGNLDWGVRGEDLMELFTQHGAVEEAIVISDKFSNRSKGFGFVTFTNDEEGEKAIEELNGADFKGRPLVVNEARPQEPRPPRDM